MILSLLIHEHGISVLSFTPMSLCISVSSFVAYRQCTHFLRFIPKYFMLLSATVNGILKNSISSCSQAAYINMMDFRILTLYLETLLFSFLQIL